MLLPYGAAMNVDRLAAVVRDIPRSDPSIRDTAGEARHVRQTFVARRANTTEPATRLFEPVVGRPARRIVFSPTLRAGARVFGNMFGNDALTMLTPKLGKVLVRLELNETRG